MKRRISVLLACVLLSTGIMQVQADNLTDLKQKKDQLEQQEKNLKEQTQNTKDAMNEANDTAAELAGTIDELAGAMDEVSTAIMEIMAEIELVEADIADKEAHIEQTKLEYAEAVQTKEDQYAAMCIRIQYMYENGNLNYVELLLTAGSIPEMLNKADYVEALYQYDRDMLTQFEQTVERIAALEVQLEGELADLEDSKTYLASAQAELDQELGKLKAESKNYELELAEVKVQAANYAAELKKQQSELKTVQNDLKKTKDQIKKEEAAIAAAQSQSSNEGGASNHTPAGSSTDGASTIASASGSDLGKQIASYGCSFIGNPYVAGGTSLTSGVDCSGFTQAVYAHFGYSIPRNSYSQRTCGREVSLANAEPGDLVCYAGHVAMYIGNGKIVHASTERTGIKIGNANYRTILSVRRVI